MFRLVQSETSLGLAHRIHTDFKISQILCTEDGHSKLLHYRKRLDAHSNNQANALFQEQLGTRGLKRLYPADLVTNG